jgi:hypothetical protein
MSRRDAYQHVVNVVDEVAGGVSKKVNILVVAELSPRVIGEDGQSGKLRKAIDLAESGLSIEIMHSRDLLRLLLV